MKIKKFIMDFFTYGMNDILAKILSIVLLPIIVRRLSVEEFGIVEVLLNATAIIPLLIGIGYDIALKKQILINKDKDHDRIKNSIKTVFLFLIVWGFSITVLLLLLRNTLTKVITGNSGHVNAVIYALIGIYFSVFIEFIQTINRSRFNLKSYTKINVVRTFITYASIIIVLYLPFNRIELYFIAILLVNIIIMIYLIYNNKDILEGRADFKILKEVISFGFPAMIAGLGYWVYQLSDRIILINLTDAKQVGLYSISIKIVSIIAFLVKAFQKAWIPRAFEIYNEDSGEFNRFVYGLKTHVAIIFSILSLAVFAISELLIYVLAGSGFNNAYLFVAPLSFSYLFYALSHISSIGLYVNNKTKSIAYINWGAAFINIVINVLFIPLFGSIIAAVSTLISYIFVHLMYSHFSGLAGMKNSSDSTRMIIFSSGSILILQYFIQFDSIILNTVFRSAVTLLYILILCYYRFIDIKKIIKILGGNKNE